MDEVPVAFIELAPGAVAVAVASERDLIEFCEGKLQGPHWGELLIIGLLPTSSNGAIELLIAARGVLILIAAFLAAAIPHYSPKAPHSSSTPPTTCATSNSATPTVDQLNNRFHPQDKLQQTIDSETSQPQSAGSSAQIPDPLATVLLNGDKPCCSHVRTSSHTTPTIVAIVKL